MSQGFDPNSPEQQKHWNRLEKLAVLMDARWQIMGVPIGLDAVLGLLPVVGDGASFLVGLYMIYEAWRMNAPKRLMLRMLLNLGVDFFVGSLPLVGDVADVIMRAHQRNYRLLAAHASRPPSTSPAKVRGVSVAWLLLALVVIAVLLWWARTAL